MKNGTTFNFLQCYHKRILSPLTAATFHSQLIAQAANILERIYPSATMVSLTDLKDFIRDFVSASQSTIGTLQVALYLLLKMHKMPIDRAQEMQKSPLFHCGRRMFLAALIISTKIHHEPSPNNLAWAKLSGLNIREVNAAEMILLESLDYHLLIDQKVYEEWAWVLQLVPQSFNHVIGI